jgi:hypothetical protein
MYACVRETGGVHVASGIKAPSYDTVHSRKATTRYIALSAFEQLCVKSLWLYQVHNYGTLITAVARMGGGKSACRGIVSSLRAVGWGKVSVQGAAAHLTRLVVHILAHPDGQGGGAARGGAGTGTTASGGRRRTH